MVQSKTAGVQLHNSRKVLGTVHVLRHHKILHFLLVVVVVVVVGDDDDEDDDDGFVETMAGNCTDIQIDFYIRMKPLYVAVCRQMQFLLCSVITYSFLVPGTIRCGVITRVQYFLNV